MTLIINDLGVLCVENMIIEDYRLNFYFFIIKDLSYFFSMKFLRWMGLFR